MKLVMTRPDTSSREIMPNAGKYTVKCQTITVSLFMLFYLNIDVTSTNSSQSFRYKLGITKITQWGIDCFDSFFSELVKLDVRCQNLHHEEL